MSKDKKKKEKKKLPEYFGMERVTKKKHKQAVEGLVKILCDLERVTSGIEINIHGRLTETVAEINGKKVKIDIWKISEISKVQISKDGKMGGGCSWMASDPECAAGIYAAEKYLESFHEKPQYSKDGKELMFDFKGESEADFRYLWMMPVASGMREKLAYLHWRANVTPDVTLSQVFTEKMFSQYDKTLREEVEQIVLASGWEAGKLIARFVKAHPELFPQPPTQENDSEAKENRPDDSGS